MGLRQDAEADLAVILENDGWPVTVTNPMGVGASLSGYSNDIAQAIDPETGQLVSGRFASVALRISSMNNVGLALPQGVADSAQKPWLIAFDDINGNSYTFKVAQSHPDRAAGIVTCSLELYTP